MMMTLIAARARVTPTAEATSLANCQAAIHRVTYL